MSDTDRSIRDLDRERAQLEKNEKQLIAEIKKSAKAGQMGAAKVQAKDLVRTRGYIKKFAGMRSQLQGVSLRVTTMTSQAAMGEAMKGCAKAMRKMNARSKLPQMQKIMMDFEMQSELMDTKQEMMDDMMDDAVGSEDEEAASDDIINSIMDELNIDIGQKLGEAAAAPSSPTPAVADGADQDLEARLESLKRS